MITMTSLEAQNQFGTLIDSSQREPVVITRRGRPVSVMLSIRDFKSLPFSVVQAVSEMAPLRGEAAAKAVAEVLESFGNRAEKDGLSEQDVTNFVHENRK
jgi:prevent-host-death family protein